MMIKICARLNIPETSLYTKVITKNDKPLGTRSVALLIPGGPGGNHSVYNSIQKELLVLFDIILFDPRGCGLSTPSNAEFCTIDHFIDDIEAVRQHFDLDKVILMGGSYGAMAAVGYAIKHGGHLEKLILLAGAPSYKFLETAKLNLEKKGTPEQLKMAEHLWNGTFKDAEHFKEYYKVMAPMYLFKQPEIKQTPPTTKPNIPYNVSVTNLGFGGFLRKFDFTPYLQTIQCETLILSGQNDWINDPCYAILMADKIPHSTLVILENCGHFIWEDQPELFFESLSKFIYKDSSHAKIRCKL